MKAARLAESASKTGSLGPQVACLGGLGVPELYLSLSDRRSLHGSHRAFGKQDADSALPKSEAARRKIKERDFFYSVLSSSATKRDAKAYLSKFNTSIGQTKKAKTINSPESKPDGVEAKQHKEYEGRLSKSGVNLGGLYTYPKAIEDTPVFSQGLLPDVLRDAQTEALHLAVVVLRSLHQYTDNVLDGVALTLAQLARLGLLSVVVVDSRDEEQAVAQTSRRAWLNDLTKQTMRVAAAIGKHSAVGARVVDQALTISATGNAVPSSVQVRGKVGVQLEQLLFTPLKSGIIPIVPPIAFTNTAQMKRVSADDVVLALARQFAGLNWPIMAEEDSEAGMPSNTDSESSQKLEEVSLDRIIILDPIGGIPAQSRPDKQHIFINLEQEYDAIRAELALEGQVAGVTLPSPENKHHLQNLELLRNALTLLPPTSSALLTTPSEAASAATSAPISQTTGVRTRPKRNPLIHNLLTDRSVISSSLPPARLETSSVDTPPLPHSTFFKRGMPVTIIPDPHLHPWTPFSPSSNSPPPLDLSTDPRVDFPRLRHLIEDSFSRPLDVQHYLARTHQKIAGLIIAGNYLGGAILTFETPGWNPSRPPVPYLDKFAVLKSAQGSGGVADVVFNAMVRNCFPQGVVWRSRIDNPVNKWYFERARGTWRVPGGRWTMFWTGDEVDFGSGEEGEEHAEERRLRWKDYVSVCESIEASWADDGTGEPRG